MDHSHSFLLADSNLHVTIESISKPESKLGLGDMLTSMDLIRVVVNNILLQKNTSTGTKNTKQIKLRKLPAPKIAVNPLVTSRPRVPWMFMSAILQKYIFKPPAVSDDIESFIHVIIWLALRFSHHRLSARPNSMAFTLFGTYIETGDTTEEGFPCMSYKRWEAIEKGTPGFIFYQKRKLNWVIETSMGLCQLQYRSTDMDQLEEFLPLSLRPKGASKKSTTDQSDSSVPKPNLSQEVHGNSWVETSTKTQAKRPLDTHEGILEVLRRSISDNEIWEKKTADQFIDLPRVVLTYRPGGVAAGLNV
ncbi:unnamed protein product [Somion occarium]|uniref:Fungal-type protein kinase domain-containing protein n=1 Tax=Somion occarium TaxID=3059160 RepID=A0ABP1DTS6_9APHY